MSEENGNTHFANFGCIQKTRKLYSDTLVNTSGS